MPEAGRSRVETRGSRIEAGPMPDRSRAEASPCRVELGLNPPKSGQSRHARTLGRSDNPKIRHFVVG